MSETKNCEWCGRELTPEEIAHPCEVEGYVVCSHCEMADEELEEGECCRCGGSELEKYLGCEGSLMVVVNDEAKVPKGIYEVLSLPFYTYNYFSMWLHTEAIKQLSNSTWGLDESDTEGFAIGFLCRNCCDEARHQLNNPVMVLPHTAELIRHLHHLIITTPAGDVDIQLRDGGRRLAVPLSVFNQLEEKHEQDQQ